MLPAKAVTWTCQPKACVLFVLLGFLDAAKLDLLSPDINTLYEGIKVCQWIEERIIL